MGELGNDSIRFRGKTGAQAENARNLGIALAHNLTSPYNAFPARGGAVFALVRSTVFCSISCRAGREVRLAPAVSAVCPLHIVLRPQGNQFSPYCRLVFHHGDKDFLFFKSNML
jgi:hypothetical protein